jgi:hypothetical protein
MINFADVQRGIIGLLRQDTNLVTYLSGTAGGSDAIREMQYQELLKLPAYPAVRVDLSPQYPNGNGKDRIILSTMTFAVYVFSEQKSSRECNHLLTLVERALFNKQIRNGLDSNNVHTYDLLRIDCTGSDPAYRMFERHWQANLYFRSEANYIYHPESAVIYPT